ncbi:Uncharacterised protein [Acinetobacter baumannii]|nr:Uncharacterised protein [Acinetobacter baumannii]
MDISHPALSALDVNSHIGQNHDGTGAANPKAKYGQVLYLASLQRQNKLHRSPAKFQTSHLASFCRAQGSNHSLPNRKHLTEDQCRTSLLLPLQP